LLGITTKKTNLFLSFGKKHGCHKRKEERVFFKKEEKKLFF